MKSIITIVFAFLLPLVILSQNYLNTEFDRDKNYVILTNPTVYNLKTIQFLVGNNLLKINTKKTHFIGLYFEKQAYNFTESEKYVTDNKLDYFHFQAIKGNLDANNIFEQNDCSELLEKAFVNSDGIFFFGGPDIQPEVYLEDNTLSDVTDPGRHLFETTFLFHLLGSYRNNSFKPLLEQKPKYLVTGFCLGMQTMNVATGGTLIQDIPSEIYNAKTAAEKLKTGKENLHRNYWQEISKDSLLMGINFHTLNYTKNPFFTKKIKVSNKYKPVVLSSHHQAVEKTGKGLVATALSPDGKIVEGLAHESYPNVFAVQFHPEVPALYKDLNLLKFAPEDEAESFNDIIGKRSLKFHKKYWAAISKALKQ